ncbi:hypothetical protein [Vulcanisaeta sp. JCM 16161]|uniref:hypothetical protein n=1 Tax=Vulcanisaeta sp. JCM 16161 TaxID=1295372 RepID=UPI0006D0C99F|nr:hypothetical protein [Vulcanisaeta sp. JCM 16161]
MRAINGFRDLGDYVQRFLATIFIIAGAGIGGLFTVDSSSRTLGGSSGNEPNRSYYSWGRARH